MSVRNTDNTIDSRDIIERLEELRSELSERLEAFNCAREELDAEYDNQDDANNEDVLDHRADVEEEYKDTLDSLTEWLGTPVLVTRPVVERTAFLDAVKKYGDHGDLEVLKPWMVSDDARELLILEALNEEGSSVTSDWAYGELLIHEDYFTEYCKEMLDDCGDLPSNMPDYIVIDWDATAENLKADYTEIDFDGTTYLVR